MTEYCLVTETEFSGERDNARNNARCTEARKTTHGLDGQHQDVDRTPSGRVNQNDRGQTEINGESTSMVWPTVGSRTGKEQNRQTDRDRQTDRQTGTPSHRIQRAIGPTYKSRNGKKTFSRMQVITPKLRVVIRIHRVK